MKSKVTIRPRSEISKWILTSNLFAKSMITVTDALAQFNRLSPSQRIEIKRAFDEYDRIRRIKIPKEEMKDEWELSVMVDAHIIATEFDIDPLTAVMCIKPICKANEKVFGK